MKQQLNERLTRTPFRPSADARADYETDGTTFLQYLARRAAKSVMLEPLLQLLAVRPRLRALGASLGTSGF